MPIDAAGTLKGKRLMEMQEVGRKESEKEFREVDGQKLADLGG